MNRRVNAKTKLHAPEILCPDLVPVVEEYHNQWFRIVNRGSYYTLEFNSPQVAILPLIADTHILLVRVKRPVINDNPLELPAGNAKDGESIRQTAQREFAEETGIHIPDLQRFEPMMPISEMPGRIPVLLTAVKLQLSIEEFNARGEHDEEITSVEIFDYPTIIKQIKNGDIYLSSVVALLSRFLFQAAYRET